MTTASTKPYLLRAIHDWCTDEGLTPHIAVLVDERVRIPPGYDQDGQIILNLAHGATSNLTMANDAISFQARFGGVPHSVVVPVSNVIAIYARENGQGMAFEFEAPTEGEGEAQSDEVAPVTSEADAPTQEESVDGSADSGDEVPAPASSRGSHLKVIK